LLLDPQAAQRAARSRPRLTGQPTPEPTLHGRPTASELVDAVREYLLTSVLPTTSGQVAFHARVAANALAIVLRELELGPDLPADANDAGPGAAAWRVAARLAVVNPRYFGPDGS
jgi:hypothetical protein